MIGVETSGPITVSTVGARMSPWRMCHLEKMSAAVSDWSDHSHPKEPLRIFAST